MSALARAMRYWVNGYPCPLHIASELMSLGYDVRALEDRHRA